MDTDGPRILRVAGAGKNPPTQEAIQAAMRAAVDKARKESTAKFATLHARKMGIELELSGLPPEGQLAICMAVAASITAENDLDHNNAKKDYVDAVFRSRTSIELQRKANKGLNVEVEPVAEIPPEILQKRPPAPDDEAPAAPTGQPAERRCDSVWEPLVDEWTDSQRRVHKGPCCPGCGAFFGKHKVGDKTPSHKVPVAK